MNAYQNLQKKALGLSFVLGPLLLTVGAAIFLLGVERGPGGQGSWVEGVFMTFGVLLMVPVYFELARVLGQRAPILGFIGAITGLSSAIVIGPAAARIVQVDIILAGLNAPIFSVLGRHPGWIPIFIGLGVGLLTSILLGIGLLRHAIIPRWAAVLLIMAPILFFVGQDGDEIIAWGGFNFIYFLGCLAWLVVMAPIGLRYLAGASHVYELEMAAA